ncbi:MAG: hypothetical protein ACUVQG_10575 [Thermogutta sp.]
MAGLLKKIRRDIKKSPAKAAALGGLVVLAVAIWGSRLRATSNPVAVEGTVAVAPNGFPVAGPTAAADKVTDHFPPGEEVKIDLTAWHVIRNWRSRPLDEDQLLSDLGRDPFAPNEVITPQPASNGTSETSKSLISLEAFGLRFTGAVVSSRDRIAILENQAVREGSVLRVERNGRSYLVMIKEVGPTSVKLTIDGVDYEQSLPDFGLKPHISRDR